MMRCTGCRQPATKQVWSTVEGLNNPAGDALCVAHHIEYLWVVSMHEASTGRRQEVRTVDIVPVVAGPGRFKRWLGYA